MLKFHKESDFHLPQSQNCLLGYHNSRAWQINEINGINDINEIHDGLINLCKLGPGLMRINDGLMWINGACTFRH